MLLDDTQVAIDELLAACRESVEHYADAAGRVEAPALRELFESVAARRRDEADRLAAAVRDGGRLPRAPYADRQEVHRLVTHAVAALVGDEAQVLVDDRIEDERRIRSLVGAVPRPDEPPADDDVLACADRIGTHSGDALAQLLAARER